MLRNQSLGYELREPYRNSIGRFLEGMVDNPITSMSIIRGIAPEFDAKGAEPDSPKYQRFNLLAEMALSDLVQAEVVRVEGPADAMPSLSCFMQYSLRT